MLDQRFLLSFRRLNPWAASKSTLSDPHTSEIDVKAPSPNIIEPEPSSITHDDFWHIDQEAVLTPPVHHCYEVALDTFFNARHFVVINNRPGPIHNHSFRVQVRCRSHALAPEDHTVVSFHLINDIIQQIAKAYNNCLLNDLPPFRTLQPTSESLAAVLFQQIQRYLASLNVSVISVTIWEAPTRSVTYSNVTNPIVE